MGWVRWGDESATYPKLMAVAGVEGADDRSILDVAGFMNRAAAQSAKHETDYLLDVGTVMMCGLTYWREVVQLCEAVGLAWWETADGVRRLRLIDDPDYFHIRKKATVEWERQRDRDNRNPALKGPVLLRDGDNCRWCGVGVYWSGKNSARKGTLDHLRPGEAGTVDTMVVACMHCNTSRQEDDSGSWDATHQLLAAPQHPIHGDWARNYLYTNGLRIDTSAPDATHGAPAGHHHTSDTPSVGALAGGACDPGVVAAPVEPGASASIPDELDPGTPDQGASAGPSSGGSGAGGSSTSGTAPPGRLGPRLGADSPSRALGTGQSPGRDGSGRDGSGPVGSGRDGPVAAREGLERSSCRTRRRRRGKGKR